MANPPGSAGPRKETRPNILTVDLEDWFHICEVEDLLPRRKWDSLPSTVEANTERILDLLSQWGATGTFFVLGYIATRFPDLIRKIHALGHEIAYHGWNHELVYDLKPQAFRDILRQGTHKIGELVGTRPLGFRAPQWSINNRSLWALDILADEGFSYDSSMAPLRFIGDESFPDEHYGITSRFGRLHEFPPFTLATPWGRYPAGGGWGLRCIPFGPLKSKVKASNERGIPVTFYLHPREMAPGGSVPGLPLSKRFVLNAGIWSSRSQITRLLSEFSFTSIERLMHHDFTSPGRRH